MEFFPAKIKIILSNISRFPGYKQVLRKQNHKYYQKFEQIKYNSNNNKKEIEIRNSLASKKMDFKYRVIE